MQSIWDFILWSIILLIIRKTTAEIELSLDVFWDEHAVTVAGASNGSNGTSITELNVPFDISVTKDDVVYISDTSNHRVVVVDLNFPSNVSILGSGLGSNPNQLNSPFGLFATNTSLYVIDANNARIQKTLLNGLNPSSLSGYSGIPTSYYLYVINDNQIYLSDSFNHRVLLFVSNLTNGTMVAGTGAPGSSPQQLNRPYGVFVDRNGTLYVVDRLNHRIMKWFAGATAGQMVAGTGTAGTGRTQLNNPSQVIVDTNGYIYITESGNNRISRWPPDSTSGVCIAACTGTSGIATNRLNKPHSLAFDTNGSIYVNDRSNSRIQKFQIFYLRKPSYNQPKLSVCATWNLQGITFANSGTAGLDPHSVFVDINNTVYVAATSSNSVRIWLENATIPSRTIYGGLDSPFSVFASINGDIYVDNGMTNYRVDKWTLNATTSIHAMNIATICYGLFIDIKDDIYCSIDLSHQIIKRTSRDRTNTTIVMAGTGTSGSASNQFDSPRGIFVDINFNMYVADYGNHRVQYFQAGQSIGITVAGNGTSGSITLNHPTAVVLDADANLFITDFDNHRIIRSGPSGSQCLLGCTVGGGGSANDELNHPYSLSFDRYGNLFVADMGNDRIQKFVLTTNSCALSYNQPKFCSAAAWNLNGTTVANISTIGQLPSDIFVDLQNTLYVAEWFFDRVQVWTEGSMTPIRYISDGLESPWSLFVASNGDIYVDNGNLSYTVNKWSLGAINSTISMHVDGICFGLFIDITDHLYCSMVPPHIVAKQPLNAALNTSIIVAGTRSAGNGSDMLNQPRGIFVDVRLNLYVADCGNNRIQFFQLGHLNGTTLAIIGLNGPFTLNCPTEVVLDSDGYLFIVDHGHHRILGSHSTGFRCVVGCTGTTGNGSHQLSFPYSLSFDNKGNLFVADSRNNRIQKFILSTNSCDESTTPQYALTSTANFESSTPSIQPTTSSTFAIESSASTIPHESSTSTIDYESNTTAVPNQTSVTTTPYQTSTSTIPHESSTSTIDYESSMAAIPYQTSATTTPYQTNTSTIPHESSTSTIDYESSMAAVPNQTSVTTTPYQTSTRTIPHESSTSTIDYESSTTTVPNQTNTNIIPHQTSTNTIPNESSATKIPYEASTSTVIYNSSDPVLSSFLSTRSQTTTSIAMNDDVSALLCEFLEPCQNSGTCINNNTAYHGYICSCPMGFSGTNCQVNTKQCRSGTCLNQGTCLETSHRKFSCQCTSGWYGGHCQMKINYCKKDTCLNRGVCEPILLNYTCHCLTDSYSGRHCEVTADKTVLLQTISRSLAYIAITAITIVATIVIVLDFLKYCLGVDPVEPLRRELQLIKREQSPKRKKPVMIVQYTYIDAPSQDTFVAVNSPIDGAIY